MQVIKEDGALPIKSWADTIEDSALQQLRNLARMPFIAKNGVAVMPDVHAGIGATVGSVIASHRAIIPAAVGVDIGCGMNAIRLSLTASDLPESLKPMRDQIERDVPVGFSMHRKDDDIEGNWTECGELFNEWTALFTEFPELKAKNESVLGQLGTLGGGNHFIEVCLDENQNVWVMLHSGSRGTGNAIGRYFIEKAKEACAMWHIELPDNDLAYFPEGTSLFDDYTKAVGWAQNYAFQNRAVMIERVIAALRRIVAKPFEVTSEAINCFPGTVDVAATDIKGAWRRWYDGPLVTLRFKSGKELPVTPNHPLLTQSGWVAAGRLNVGDSLIRASGANDLRSRIDPDVKCVPSKFSELFDAINCFGMSQRVVGSAVNFHGDIGDGEVHVVTANRKLRYGAQAPLFQKLRERGFLSPDLAESLGFGRSLLDQFGFADGAGPSDEVRGQCVGEALLRRELAHASALSGAAGAEFDASTAKDFCDAWRADSRFVGEGNDRNAGGVFLDEIIEVVRGHFAGHVFNLSTDSGWYVAGGIISHNCHHNYVAQENHYGQNLWVTRKGAIRAREGDLGIIPGSMGQRSYIVCGKGHPESYCSCSHGAGRVMSRTEAKRRFSLTDLIAQTEGVECRKDEAVIDEIPGAYKSIDTVMANQLDLVSVVHELKQVLCIKG